MDGMSLLDVLRGVMLDPAQQALYNAGPGPYLQQYGFDDVDPADLSEAFGLVADTLPPDQAQAAWEAAAEPDDGSFGTVTADFDGIDAAPNGAEATTTEPASDEPGAEPTLSFGEGEDGAGVLDDPTFGDDPSGLSAGLGVDDADAGDVLEHGLGEDVDTAGPDDGAVGDDLDDGIDDGLHDDLHDDFDDVGEIDGLGGIDDQGPDDTDIGSF